MDLATARTQIPLLMPRGACGKAPSPVRRIVYNVGDIDHIWSRVAVQCEAGVWMWDCSELDRIRIEHARDRGNMRTTWERRDDDTVWLLVQAVVRPKLRVV
jgi:hypothetical protein